MKYLLCVSNCKQSERAKLCDYVFRKNISGNSTEKCLNKLSCYLYHTLQTVSQFQVNVIPKFFPELLVTIHTKSISYHATVFIPLIHSFQIACG
jgi:hypothetical protein